MREKPILFKTEMVRDILGGRKTMIRIPVRNLHINQQDGRFALYEYNERRDEESDDFIAFGAKNFVLAVAEEYAPYHPGNLLYVRETWSQTRCFDCDFECDECELNIERNGKCPPDEGFCDDGYYVYRATDRVNSIDNGQIKWRQSIHMPKKAARIWLKVTDVRVERLQDITVEQAMLEGVSDDMAYSANGWKPTFYDPDSGGKPEYIKSFSYLWDSTIKKKDLPLYGWDANPWCFVISFEKIDKSEVLNAQ